MKENNYLIKEKIKYLVIHCSDTDNHDTAKDIHKLHISFGWEGIGYHKVIKRNGEIENGRPEFWIGAHVYGFNNKSLGVCLIGKNNFTKKQMESLKKVSIKWKLKYPNSIIRGHNEFKDTKKTCPNFNVKLWCKKNEL